MEKKYKLIMEYPGGPKLGEEITTDKYGKVIVNNLTFFPGHYPKHWQEIKEPLFITDDDIEINSYTHEIFVVNKKIFKIDHSFELCQCAYPYIKDKGYIYFSTEQAAKDWIENNKPMFSKQQIFDAYEKNQDKSMQRGNFIHWNTFLKDLGI